MVNISKQTEDSILFEFQNSQHYLCGNGEISVPLNSLQLVIDNNSDMVTFKKLDGDPFVSFNIDESNFASKDALVEFYETEMVGGGGIPTEEIQEMIDESIAPIKAETVTDAEYISSAHTINLYNISGTVLSSIDATDFIKDGMVSNVEVKDVEISGETVQCLVLTFNTDSGKEPINIPLSDLSLPIDSALSANSPNAVANSAITEAIANATDGKLKEDLVFSATCGYGSAISKNGMSVPNQYKRINIYPAKSVNFSGYRSYEHYYYKCFILDVETKTEYNAYWNVNRNYIESSGGDGINYVMLTVPDGKANFSVTNESKYRIVGFERDVNPTRNGRGEYRGSSTYTVNIPSGTSINEVFGYVNAVNSNIKGLTFGGLYGTNIHLLTDENGAELQYGEIYALNDFLTAHTANTTIHVTSAQTDAWDAKIDSSAITSSITSASTETEIPSAKAVYDAIGESGGGLDEDFLQANANALYELKQEGKATNERFDNYYTKAASDGKYASNASIKKAYYDKAYVDDKLLAISASLNELNDDKQDALVAGDGISISGNVISAEGGGGAEYSAGTNISIDSANTISCTIPISGNDYNSISILNNTLSKYSRNCTYIGENNTSNENATIYNNNVKVFGSNNNAHRFNADTIIIGKSNVVSSVLEGVIIGSDNNVNGTVGLYRGARYHFGKNLKTSNLDELALAKFNSTVHDETANSGSTAFSIGNGYDASNRHNALEIRQNGDLYYVDTYDTTTQNYYEKPMLKLQDVIKDLTDRIAALESQLNNN